MNLVDEIMPEFIDAFPTPMQSGVLYVSIPYRTTGHLCCCGCGEEVIAPLAPAQWILTYDGDTVSLTPSIGNWGLQCQSHYVIRRNKVLPARLFTSNQIDDNRASDRKALDRYYGELSPSGASEALESGSRTLPLMPASSDDTSPKPRWWSRLASLLSRRPW